MLLVWLQRLARRRRWYFRRACYGLKVGGVLKCFGAAILGLSLMINAHADNGRSSKRSGDDKSRLETGISRFMFDGWAGPELRVWTYVPNSVSADAPILFVMHGVERDAKRYLEDWARTAERVGVILIAPEFDERRFPGPEAYNQGGVIDPRTGKKRDPAVWTFSAIEPLFAEVKRRTGSRAGSYSIYGHSAGAQFVHRFVMLAHPVHLDHAVAANAGWYTWFDPDRPFPQGMRLNRQDYVLDRSGFGERLTILLGTEDIEADDRNLRDDAWTRGQGQNRLERGRAFYAHAKEVAGSSVRSFKWRLQYAPGIAHENRKMALYAADILFRENNPQALPEVFFAFSSRKQSESCYAAAIPGRKTQELSKTVCIAVAGVQVETSAAKGAVLQQSNTFALLDQPIRRDFEGKPPRSLASSIKIALIDAEGRDPKESSKLERKVDGAVEQGATLVILINSPTDGRVRRADHYTVFHLPRQRSGRQDRDAGRAATDPVTLIALAPDTKGQRIGIQVYPSLDQSAASKPTRWVSFVESVRRIVARTRDRVRFEAGQDEVGDYLAFAIDWPRRE